MKKQKRIGALVSGAGLTAAGCGLTSAVRVPDEHNRKPEQGKDVDGSTRWFQDHVPQNVTFIGTRPIVADRTSVFGGAGVLGAI